VIRGGGAATVMNKHKWWDARVATAANLLHLDEICTIDMRFEIDRK
jgi:hypothetical protein